MKFPASLLVLLVLLNAGTTHATESAIHVAMPDFATWNIAELDDVTQGWYFTGEALADQQREGAPWAADHMARRGVPAADAPPAAPAPIVIPARVAADVPTVPEPSMVSMLLVGLVLIFLSVGGERQETFNS